MSFKTFLTEDYDQRVKDAADDLNKMYPGGLSKDTDIGNLVTPAMASKYTELRLKGLQRQQFLKDVRKLVKTKKIGSPSPMKGMIKGYDRNYSESDLRAIANKFQDVAGQAFPDGDPLDIMSTWWRRNLRFEIDNKILDVAVKKFLGSKDANTYLADLWDSFAGDNPNNEMDVKKSNNPWR